MKATTIKLEGDLLIELRKLKGSSKSVTSFVKETLESEVRRHKMRRAAETYGEFLKEHPEESKLLDEWENAPLSNDLVSKGEES